MSSAVLLPHLVLPFVLCPEGAPLEGRSLLPPGCCMLPAARSSPPELPPGANQASPPLVDWVSLPSLK